MAVLKGILVISLDLELYWGVRDIVALEDYKGTLLRVHTVVPALLELFHTYGIHATWAVVGFLFSRTREELINILPNNKPAYINSNLSPYNHIRNIGLNAADDPFHFAPSFIQAIGSVPDQEIGTHTFSHYYCLEKGQNALAFRDDLNAATQIAGTNNIELKSIVFPRNQVNHEYLSICSEMGISAYRGNQRSWIFNSDWADRNFQPVTRLLRLLDSYFNISGHNCHSLDTARQTSPVNIPASRFLRARPHRWALLEQLRLKRVLSDLTYAAKKGLVYHLWWHPENFGTATEQQLSCVKEILNHYSLLRESYGMESLNMGELSRSLLGIENLDTQNCCP